MARVWHSLLPRRQGLRPPKSGRRGPCGAPPPTPAGIGITYHGGFLRFVTQHTGRSGSGALGDVLPRLGRSVMGAAPRTETETRGRETRVENRLQDLQDGLLDQAVDPRRSTTAGMPKGRIPPPGSGVATPRTGHGR